MTVLDVVDDPDLGPDTLRQDDTHGVVPAEVPDRMYSEARIVGDVANAAIADSVAHLIGIDSASNSRAALTLPYLRVVLAVGGLTVQPLLLQHRREPRIIVVIDLHHDRAWRGGDDKPGVSLIGVQLRVERHPYLGAVGSDRRREYLPGAPGYALRLLDPANIHALKRFERLGRHRRQTREQKQRAIVPPNLGLQHRECGAQPHRLYLRSEQPMHRVPDGFLYLSRAQHTDWAARR